MEPFEKPNISSTQADGHADKSFEQFALLAAGVGIWELRLAQSDFILDAQCRNYLELPDNSPISIKRFLNFVHPDDVDAVDSAIKNALNGDDGGQFDIQFRTISAGDRRLKWLDFSGQAFFDADGKATRFGGVAKDVTTHMLSALNSDRSDPTMDRMLRSIVSSAPIGIALFVGRDLIIEMPNKVFIDIVGRGPDIVGRSLKDVMPELENQPFLDILDRVFTTGEAFNSPNSPADIMHNGKLERSYFHITFTPLLDNEGKTYAILDVSMEVTEATMSRLRIEEGRRILQDAVELAKIATWTIDLTTGFVEYSDRMKSWLGVPDTGRKMTTGLDSLPDHERERVRTGLQKAMSGEDGGLFDMEYAILNQIDKRERIIHSQARTFFDESGKPVKMVGTALDVTEERNRRLFLEQEVQFRTEELDAANEELQVTNEELQNSNEELAQLNEELRKSNESLQQFAHVASHDLKEPVRKIKTFLGMITTDQDSSLSQRSRSYLDRVNSATDRMFAMINGVLTYSTANTAGQPVENVDLDRVIEHILQDLEVIVTQKKATIKFNNLPIIEGAEILLYQLFSNLIINSLKFSKKDVPPVIELIASQVQEKDNAFIQIEVRDNGIGFEPHQSEEIFRTFARLHSKDKYEGTGLGLALCQKIVEQHGGRIQATGKAGSGATFTILLPIRQAGDVVG